MRGGYIKKCLLRACTTKSNNKSGYCSYHKAKAKNLIRWGLPLTEENFLKNITMKGDRNVNWKGGVALYPNHAFMKRQRLIKIEQLNGKCEDCGGEGKEIHHLDGKKTDHSLDNLKLLCKKCHMKYRFTSKLVREYDMNGKEISKLLGISLSLLYTAHRQGYLKELLINRK